jgi:hypothetical protein
MIPPELASTFLLDFIYILKLYDPRSLSKRDRIYDENGELSRDERPMMVI